MQTAEVFYQTQTRSCVVRRFDRHAEPNRKSLRRLVQYDFCQLADIVSEKKYEKEGGPDLQQCASIIRQHSVQPAVDLCNLLAWVFFNLFTGNNDSHAKNLSMLEQAGGGLALSPFYDLMCTRIYPGLSKSTGRLLKAHNLYYVKLTILLVVSQDGAAFAASFRVSPARSRSPTSKFLLSAPAP